MKTQTIVHAAILALCLHASSMSAGKIIVGQPFDGTTVIQESVPVGALVVAPFKNKELVGVVTSKGLQENTYAINFGTLTHDPTLENMVLDHCTPIFSTSDLNVSIDDIKAIPGVVIGANAGTFSGTPADAFNNGEVVKYNGKIAVADIIVDYDTYNIVTKVLSLKFDIVEQSESNNTDILLLCAQ